MKKFTSVLVIFFVFATVSLSAQSFRILPLGVHGGLEENNLSAYLVGQNNSDYYIAMDAGTLNAGLQKCAHKYFGKTPIEVIQQNIGAYYISHPHLDHLAGLVQNAPSDSKKNIYGLDFTIDAFVKHYFSWDTWANFGDLGEKPILKKYHLETMQMGIPIVDSTTNFKISAYPLSHSNPGKSSAFLIENALQEYLLYLGDTGADTIEKQDNIRQLWKIIAPLVANHQLKAIMIEVSFPNSQPDKLLFGHLTPHFLNQELGVLASYTSLSALKKLPIIVTHIKPDGNNEKNIHKELKSENPYQVKWIFPKQGKMIHL